jgi:MoxR-like ATPase
MSDSASWKIYSGDGTEKPITSGSFPPAPPWRQFSDNPQDAEEQQHRKGESFKAPELAIEMVNAALILRRPLLITGNPGTGKSTLAYAVARELGLGSVLKWPITTRSTLKDGLYSYDAIGRMQDGKTPEETGNYVTLGALGTAFLPRDSDLPRVLLIDEIDKSDIDLPNDLLNLFEDGEFAIPELERLERANNSVWTIDRQDGKKLKAEISNGMVRCRTFPLVIMTSNGERDFSPPFLRRCLRFAMPNPRDADELRTIVEKQLGAMTVEQAAQLKTLIEKFHADVKNGQLLATDQLLNAIHIRLQEGGSSKSPMIEAVVLRELNRGEAI